MDSLIAGQCRGLQDFVIVGDGRVGRALAQMAGHRARLVKRGQIVADEADGDAPYPIIVATHCSHLDSVLKKTCQRKWKDLVFMQNGMLQPWLQEHGLQDNTQVLLFMSAAPENPLQPKGKMTYKHGGRDSLVWGRWADSFVEIMQHGGLCCERVPHEKFMNVMIEKLLWSSIFWLICHGLGGLSVGTIAQRYMDHVKELTNELLPLAVDVQPNSCAEIDVCDMVERLCAYSRAIPDALPSKSMALSEFNWRNGWFLKQKLTPCHVEWLARAGITYSI